MKPAPTETAELLQRVRQQLILAQVRIMELEDVRDELAPKLAGTEKLLGAAQMLADQKIDEARHLTRVQADLQAQCDHLRHVQHLTNQALNETRNQFNAVTRQLETTATQLAASDQRGQQLQRELAAVANQAAELKQTLNQTGLELAEASSAAATRLARIVTLESELRAMKASRSWRWTRWLRSVERTFNRHP